MKFSEKVWKITKKIPKGKVTTYKIIAKKLNSKAYRAVGQALKSNKKPIIIPCHRVIRSDGTLGGYMGETIGQEVQKKNKLLRKEGIEIKKKRINLRKYLFRF